ncbi:MAG: trypsin-like peptidase domain-containing protein [Xanthomonadales bacterium]|nr:trypsin-like peptidase domain-containing protein [Xanthomonadales bacterium]
MNRMGAILGVVAVLLLALIAYPQFQRWWISSQAEPRAITARGDLAADEQSTIEIFEKLSPSVAYIATVERRVDFFTRNVTRVPSGTGSGFFWDDNGHVVTNYHVVRGAEGAQVILTDDRAYDAALVGFSPEHDLAVLRISVPVAPPAPIPVGTSGDLKVGQKVLAIGNPFGLDYSLTTGIISALNRSISGPEGGDIEGLIQTDAAINPGNSGGPLLDSAGRLIGVNTAIFSPSGAYAGIGFAVPVDTVNEVVPRLIAYGRLLRPTIGIQVYDDISERITGDLGVTGVLVVEVTPGSGAERAGLQPTRVTRRDRRIIPGDVILSVDGQPVSDGPSLRKTLDVYQPGDRVTLELFREGETRQAQVTLSASQ